MTHRFRHVAAVAAAVSVSLLMTAPTRAAAPPAAPGWPQEHSDIAADPSVRFGQLDNGMRYAIQKNATPAAQVSLRLRLASGSLQETDSQQGLAHFLEHMAFRGSATVPDGEVWKRLERLGLKMGADTNAFTGQSQTVYKFDLARNDGESLDTGLSMLRETGDALTLDGKAFDAERGVVLSEMRLNDNPSRHMGEELQRFVLAGQRASERQPIGKQDVLEHAPVSEARSYYETWYRPERATLIVTGDVDVDAVEAKIHARFDDWKPRAPAVRDPDLGTPPRRASAAHVYVDPGAPSLTVLSWVQPYDASPDTVVREQRELARQVALAVLNRRIQEAAAGANRQFTQGQIGYSPQAHSAMVTTLYVQQEAGEWRRALLAVEALRRQALSGGLQQTELEREVTTLRSQFQAEAAAAATRRTPQLADSLLSTLDTGDVYTSPVQDLALGEKMLRSMNRTKVNEALRGLFAGSATLAFVSSPVAIDGGEEAVLRALDQADGAKIHAATAVTDVRWPYTSFGRASQVVSREYVADLNVTEVRYANGVRLNIKPTQFSADQVLVNVNVAGGRVAMDSDAVPIGWASGAVVQSGTRKLDLPAIERVLAGKQYHVSFQITDTAFAYSGQTTKADLSTQLQLLTAYVSDPGWRAEAFEQQRSAMLPQLTEMEAVPMMRFQTGLGGLLHQQDLRWAYPGSQQVKSASAEQLKALIEPALGSAPIEVAVVGDVDVEQTIAAVGATFGALPERSAERHATATTKFPAATKEPVVLTHRGAPEQGVAAVAWPTTDAFTGLPLSASRLLLADVMQQRLFDAVRVKAGTSYTTQAMSQTSSAFPGYGILLAFADIPPPKADVFFGAVAKIVGDLKEQGPTADELDRARNPAVAKITQARQTNGYWLGLIGQLQSEPRFAELARRTLTDLETATAADVQRAARNYLLDEREWRLIVKAPDGN